MQHLPDGPVQSRLLLLHRIRQLAAASEAGRPEALDKKNPRSRDDADRTGGRRAAHASERGRDRALLPRARIRHEPDYERLFADAKVVEGTRRRRLAGDADQRRSDDTEPDHEKIVQDDFDETRLLQ